MCITNIKIQHDIWIYTIIGQYHAEKFVCPLQFIAIIYCINKQMMMISHDTARADTWNERCVKILPLSFC